MVTKSRKTSAGKKKKVKVLSLKRETLKDLTAGETKRVRGGVVVTANNQCAAASRAGDGTQNGTTTQSVRPSYAGPVSLVSVH